MPVPADITLLSTTAASNSPPGTESPALADDYLRAQAAFIAQLRAVIGGATDANIPNAVVKQANSTDTTAGSVLIVGAGGLLVAKGQSAPQITDWNTVDLASGTYYLGASATNKPPMFAASSGALVVVKEWAGNTSGQGELKQLAFDRTGKIAYRVANDVSAAWVELATSANSLGKGQTWQDVTGSRALGVTYTNSTGRPIMAAVSSFSSASSFLVLTVAGQIIPSTLSPSAPSSTAIIPDGATYSAALSAGTASSLNWKELR